jgi:hypothetical protein
MKTGFDHKQFNNALRASACQASGSVQSKILLKHGGLL